MITPEIDPPTTSTPTTPLAEPDAKVDTPTQSEETQVQVRKRSAEVEEEGKGKKTKTYGDSCPGFGSPGCKGLVSDEEEGTRCKVCLQQGNVSRWCSKECYLSNFPKHKAVHKSHDPFAPLTSKGKFAYTGSVRALHPSGVKKVPRDIVQRTVPDHIPRPDYVDHPQGQSLEERKAYMAGQPRRLKGQEIEGLRDACRIAREILDIAAEAIQPGMTTLAIDQIVHDATIERDAYPSPLGYGQFPRSVCTSVNEIICHGIPDLRPLQATDIINIDVSVFYNGYHGDVNSTYPVDPSVTPPECLHLIRTTRKCLDEAIKICKPGVPIRQIGKVIETIAGGEKMGVVRKYTGHGINTLFHTEPNVPHYAANKARHDMKEGMTFTIEPMINLGDYRDIHWPDDWTAATRDGRPSAQFEETLLITSKGVEVLTAKPGWKLGDGWKDFKEPEAINGAT